MDQIAKGILGIIVVAVTLTFMFFLSSIYQYLSVQQLPLLTKSYEQYGNQKDIESEIIDTEQIAGVLQKSSNDSEQQQMASLQTEVRMQSTKDSIKSQYYNDNSEKSVEDNLMGTTKRKTMKLAHEVFTKFSDPVLTLSRPKIAPLVITSTTITPSSSFLTTPINISTESTNFTTTLDSGKYKFTTYLKASISESSTEVPKLLERNLNLANFANFKKTDLFSSSGTSDGTIDFKEKAQRKTMIFGILSTSRHLTTTVNSELLKTSGVIDANQSIERVENFITNLQNLRSTTNSALTVASQELTRKEMMDEEVEAAEVEEDDYEHEDILHINSTSTTTTTTTTVTSVIVPKFTPVPHPYRHHHHQYEHYDRHSPIIVTALFDIGRGKWPRYTRTYEQYMDYLKHLLKLRNCLIIYTDSRGAQFVRQMRSAHNTQIFEMSMHDLPLYRYREEIEGIILREQKDWRFGPKTRHHPEANSADYNIIVNSKPYFLYNATQSSRFRASGRMFVWIDAGYGHGREGIIPSHCHWRPQLRRDRMTIIKLTPAHDKVSRYSITDLYRVDWVVLSGGFIAGDSHTINRFYRFYQKSFMELLDSGKTDDDQTVLTLMLKHYETLFNPISTNGDWYALFRIFPCY